MNPYVGVVVTSLTVGGVFACSAGSVADDSASAEAAQTEATAVVIDPRDPTSLQRRSEIAPGTSTRFQIAVPAGRAGALTVGGHLIEGKVTYSYGGTSGPILTDATVYGEERIFFANSSSFERVYEVAILNGTAQQANVRGTIFAVTPHQEDSSVGVRVCIGGERCTDRCDFGVDPNRVVSGTCSTWSGAVYLEGPPVGFCEPDESACYAQ